MRQAAGGDVGVRRGVDIGIYAHRHPRLHAVAMCQRVDQRQFGLRFAVENEDAGFESGVDFGRGFADAGEDDFLGIAAGFQDAEELASGDDVESGAGFCEQTQDREVAVGFHRVADGMRLLAEGFVVGSVGFENRAGGVDVARRAGFGGDVG